MTNEQNRPDMFLLKLAKLSGMSDEDFDKFWADFVLVKDEEKKNG